MFDKRIISIQAQYVRIMVSTQSYPSKISLLGSLIGLFKVAHSGDAADGYVLFFSCSEWWRFKTPFYAWFSRSYKSMMLPLLWDWGFTNGHASGPQCSVSLGTGTSDEDIWGKSCKFKLLPSSIFLMPVIIFQQHEKTCHQIHWFLFF